MQPSRVSSAGSWARTVAASAEAANSRRQRDFMKIPPEGGSGTGTVPLLVTKRLNRVLERRLPGRVVSERNPHPHRHDEGQGDGRQRNDRAPLRIESDDLREGVSDDDSREAARDAENDRLGEELREYVRPPRSHRAPDPDLPRPFEHGGEHD